MTDATWKKVLRTFDENLQNILGLEPCKPTPSARFCRESAHRTLGHLTACQAAWLPMIKSVRDGHVGVVTIINPDPLFGKLGFKTADWDTMVQRFVAERAEWREALGQVDLNAPIQTQGLGYTVQTLTTRMVNHEKRHLQDLSP